MVVVVDVDVVVDVVEVLVDVVVDVLVESMMKLFVASIALPCESTTFAVTSTFPNALTSKGIVKLAEFDVRAFETMRVNITLLVSLLVTK
jgi:hypothetical protein